MKKVTVVKYTNNNITDYCLVTPDGDDLRQMDITEVSEFINEMCVKHNISIIKNNSRDKLVVKDYSLISGGKELSADEVESLVKEVLE